MISASCACCGSENSVAHCGNNNATKYNVLIPKITVGGTEGQPPSIKGGEEHMYCLYRTASSGSAGSRKIGERHRSDIAFPAVKGIGGESCVLTRIDEGNGYVRVFLLASKGKAF
jgi:hypothetical protein